MSLEVGFDAQVPSLPDAGGMTSSLGETFSSEPSTGTAEFSIRIDTPNGPNDIGPRLALRYDSASGNGPFGLGFGLRLPRIVRSSAHGFPRYEPTDSLMLEGAGELVAMGDGSLRPVVDGGAWRVEIKGDGYQLTDRAGSIYTLGTSPVARMFDAVANPDGAASATFAWHLEGIADALGNAAVFEWAREGNQLYLARVTYGVYRIDFSYAARPDTLRWGRPGFLVETRRRCERIELSMPREAQPWLRRWTLGYAQHELNGGSLLSMVALTGIDAAGTMIDAPPLSLGYSTAAPRTLTRMRALDDGAVPGPIQRRGRRAELIDWFGTGLPDLLEISGGGRARVWPNIGDLTWGRPQNVGTLPLFSAADAAVAFVDMNGDGMADLVRADQPLSGYVPRSRDGFERPVSWSRAPPVGPMDTTARLSDADGDGVMDLLVSNGDSVAIYYREDPEGWSPVPQVLPAAALPAAKLRDPHVFFADMTGSGSPDLVRVDGGGVTYWPALGRGRYADAVSMANPPALPFDFVPAGVFLQDIDGDGCADLIYLDKGQASYWINQAGCGFSEMRSVGFLPVGAMAEARWADMSGSGSNGLLWSATLAGRLAYFYLDFVGGAKSYLLDTVDNGCGLVTEVEYTTSAREAARDRAAGTSWPTAMPIVVPVVSAIDLRDQATGVVTRTEYRYHDGRYDGILREFAGFGRVERLETGDATAPRLLETTWFLNGRTVAGDEPRTRDERMALRALRGRLLRQERSSPDGTPQQALPFDRLEQTWIAEPVVSDAGIFHRPRLVQSVRTVFERTAGPVTRQTTVNTAWDDEGNVTDSIESSESVGGNEPLHVLRTHCDFAVDPARRFVSLPWRTRQFDGSDAIIADTVTEYDNEAEGRVGAQGLVTRRSALVLTDALIAATYGTAPSELPSLGYFQRPGEPGWWIVQAAYTRSDDGQGLRGTTTNAGGSTTAYVFNAARTFPVAVTDPMGNVTTALYDERIARPTVVTDAGGTSRRAIYDGLARMTLAVDDGDSIDLPTIAFTYVHDSVPVARQRRQRAASGQAPTIDTRELFDGAGRLIERRESDRVGELAVVSRRHCSRGFVARAWRPFRRPSALYGDPGDWVPSTIYTYDALGRLVRTVNPDGSVRTTAYCPLLVESADEEDNNANPGAAHRNTPTRQHLDATGRVIRVEQNLGGRWIASRYEYDIKGNLIRHVDEAGNEVRFWFDLLGRQLRVQRPERDTRVLRDAMGRPVASFASGAEPVFRQFDAAGRLVTLRLGSADAEPLQRFTYHDTGLAPPPDAGLHTSGGRLVRIDDEAGSTVFDYDERGRQCHRSWQPLGGDRTYALDTEFRADGRIAATTYPDGGSGRRRVENVYDLRGRLVGVPTLVPEIDLDITGQIVRMLAANGTELQIAHDDATGRTTSRKLTGAGGWQRATGYVWDKVGNLVSISSPDSKLAVDYAYDDLYRLTGADTALGEHYEYRYADNGAIAFKSDVGEYRYGEGGAASTCLTTAGAQALVYGPMGDVISAPWGDQTFDALGRLRRISRGGASVAEYVYDWAGLRVVSTAFDAQGVATRRMTPDPHYSVESGVLVLNLFAGPQIVARQVVGGATAFLHLDHLGGLVAVSDESGQLKDTLRYDPYGSLIERTDAGLAQPIGFTGGEYDATSGLVYLQARHYHPGLGVFISVDPVVQDPMNPIAWAAYVYCGGNPATRVDPSGLSFNLGKFLVGVAAVVALVALVVVTDGLASPAAAAVVGFGAGTGGLIGAITVAREEQKAGRDADFWDVVLGATIGAAVGGWASYATVYGTPALGKIAGEGLGNAVFGGNDILSGALNNMVTQSAAGFAHAVASPIAGTGGVDADFFKDLAQSAISGAVSGAAQGALFGGFNTRDLTDEQQEAAEAQNLKEPFTGKFSPTRMGLAWRLTGAIIVSTEQVATSQIDWHPNFFAGTAENARAGSALDVVAGLFATALLVNSF